MNTAELLAHYQATPATDQAKFLTQVLSNFGRKMEADYGRCSMLNPTKPRCPKCRRKVTTLLDIDTSWIMQEARIDVTDDGEPYIDAASAETGDYHVSFFLTPCCRAAVTIPPETHIEFS